MKLVFFDFVTHYGGSIQSTVQLIHQLQLLTPVVVLDAYGICPEYLDALRQQGTPVHVVDPNAARSIIGGRGIAQRLLRLAGSAPDMIRLIFRLRKMICRIDPRAIWMNSEKALFLASRAVGHRLPKAFYVRGEFACIKSYVRRDWKRVGLVLGVSRAAVAGLREHAFLRRIEVVYSGVNVGDVLERAQADPGLLPGNDCPLRIAMPASLLSLKNHAMAIRGLAAFLDKGGRANLLICGDSPNVFHDAYARDLQALPRRLGIDDSVHFLGWHDNVPAVVARSDVMALTSNTEGLPRCVLEGMALGKPVLVTGAGGTPELVRDGIDGIILPRDDEMAFARGLQRLSDAGLRACMGQAGRQRVESDFSLARQAERFCQLMSQIADQSS